MKEFYIEEYKSLIEDRNYRIRETRKLEFYVIGGLAGMFTWLLTNNPENRGLFFLPILLPIFGLYRSFTLRRSILLIIDYIMKLELLIYKDIEEIEGYENFRNNSNKSGVTKSSIIFWFTIIVVSFFISILGFLGSL